MSSVSHAQRGWLQGPAPGPWVAAALALLTGVGALLASAQSPARYGPEQVAHGRFSVELRPAGEPAESEGVTTARHTLLKRFEGGLQGHGVGEMLSARTPEPGSAGYVAIERVTGTLDGRAGSFVLQHSGTMAHGEQMLTIGVVPGSGTGALAGLEGRFTLDVQGGEHHYALAYRLPR